MPKKNDEPVLSIKRFQGLADYPKESSNGQIPDTYFYGKAINYRDDPQSLTLLPGSIKESGSVVTDLLKFADIVPVTLTSYLIGNAGNFYSRTAAGVWTNLHTIPQNHGNGLAYFSGDDYIYVAGDSSLSRYGPIQNSPVFTSNFLRAQGGVPLNTASILLASASSMYGHAADSSSLSITADLTLEAYFKANSLPTVNNSMTLIGKWDESGALRSYKMDLFAISGYFGTGADGALTVSVNTTEAPIDSACAGTVNTQTLSATNASFAQGQVILIHQSQGTNAGQWERNTIAGYSAGTITLGTPLLGTYTTGAQVRVLKQYSSMTVNAGVTWTAKAWTGTTGGILSNLCSGTITVTGAISASGTPGPVSTTGGSVEPGNGGGFRGGITAEGTTSGQGEGTAGVRDGTSTSANGNGAGSSIPAGNNGAGGSGGGNGAVGNLGIVTFGATTGAPGTTAGSADLTSMVFGGGGAGGAGINGTSQGAGGNGGGIIFIIGVGLVVTGTVISGGGDGGSIGSDPGGSGGGGAGGSILLKAQTATLGSGLVSAPGGVGGSGGNNGGSGGVGRITLDYLTSYSGTTTPTLNPIQDSTLVTSVTYQARLGISNDGTAFEYLTQNLANLTTGTWNRLSIAWTAAAATANFYFNGSALGTFVGTKTSISDNTSLLYVGANKNATVVTNYFDGLLNDVRIWSNLQTASQIFANLNIQVPVAAAGLAAYYKFNSAATDATGNANNLTLVNSPTYSTDVPFANPTTRLDIDVTQNLTGQTYGLPTAITEGSADEIAWTPLNDPQASVGFVVSAKGTGDWTVTVHDQQNRLIATKTILNASIPASGFVEFVYPSAWRLVAGEKYHMHLSVSTGTSSVVTGTVSNFSTAEYTTYFQFLVTDTQFHPMIQFQYQPLGGTLTGAMIIGNERYIAIWDGANFLPNFIQFPPGWHVRCFAFWRNYLAIGMWRGGAITDFDRGKIYFWTGYQPAYDFDIDVPEGQINAMFGVDSDLYFFAGYRGILLDYKGGYFYNTGNSSSNKLKRMPNLSPADYTEVYPGALTMWRGYLHFSLYGSSNSTTAQKGTYSFGTLNQWYPDTLSYDYVISTGNNSSSVSIGLTYAVGQNLIVGWQDGIAYGADVINFANPPAQQGELQTLILDSNAVWKYKENQQIRADFLPLRIGESIQLEQNVDRSGWILESPVDSSLNDPFTKMNIGDGRGREIQFGVKLFSTPQTVTTLSTLPPYERGVALSGLEFASSSIPGANGINYFATADADFAYFAKKGFTLIRLPLLWERLQPTLNGPLDPTYKSYIDAAIASAKTYKMKLILDIHNYGRYTLYADGGITENFTESNLALIYPWADYSQAGSIVLRNYGQALLGTFNNPASGSSYTVSFNLKFNSKDDSFGGEGLQIKPMWQSDNQCYNFNATLADNTWKLTKIINGVSTTLASGTKTWGTANTYAVLIDINQATAGKINVSINGTPLFTTNSVSSDNSLNKGKVAFFPQGVHVQLDTLILNIAGVTSGGGPTTEIVGSASVPISAFASLWTQIATAYTNEPTIFMYDLMNEWHDMGVPISPTTYNSTATVTLANQAAINAIRAVDTLKYIAIESDQFSGLQDFTAQYGSNPSIWWTDLANKTMISFHYYQDSDHSGTYATAWSSTLRSRLSGEVTPALTWAQANSVTVFVGEYGVPNGTTSDDINWQTDLDTFLGILDSYEAYGTQWAGGVHYGSPTTLEPTSNYTVDQAQMAILTNHLGKINTTMISTTTQTSPTLIGLSLLQNPLQEEEQF